MQKAKAPWRCKALHSNRQRLRVSDQRRQDADTRPHTAFYEHTSLAYADSGTADPNLKLRTGASISGPAENVSPMSRKQTGDTILQQTLTGNAAPSSQSRIRMPRTRAKFEAASTTPEVTGFFTPLALAAQLQQRKHHTPTFMQASNPWTEIDTSAVHSASRLKSSNHVVPSPVSSPPANSTDRDTRRSTAQTTPPSIQSGFVGPSRTTSLSRLDAPQAFTSVRPSVRPATAQLPERVTTRSTAHVVKPQERQHQAQHRQSPSSHPTPAAKREAALQALCSHLQGAGRSSHSFTTLAGVLSRTSNLASVSSGLYYGLSNDGRFNNNSSGNSSSGGGSSRGSRTASAADNHQEREHLVGGTPARSPETPLSVKTVRLLHDHIEHALNLHGIENTATPPKFNLVASGASAVAATASEAQDMLQIMQAMLALELDQSERLLQKVIQMDLQAVALSHPGLFAAVLPAAASCSLPMRKTVLER